MFKTAIRQQTPAIRQTQTPHLRRQLKIHLQETAKSKFDDYSFRPSTTDPTCQDRNYRNINTTRKSLSSHYSTIGAVQSQLQSSLQQDFTHYLRNKMKVIAKKKQQDVMYDSFLNSTINPEISLNSSLKNQKNISQFYTFFQKATPIHTEKIIDEAYVKTTKQKIIRLVGMKREQELNYSELRKKIKSKCTEHKEHILRQKEIDTSRTIANEEWDQQWRQECKKEVKRYRNRLLSKFKRHEAKITI